MNEKNTPPRENTTGPAAERRAAIAHAPGVGYDGYGKAASHCGDSIEFFINLETADDSVVNEVRCRVRGCDNTKISARAAGMLVKGQPLKIALQRIAPEQIDALAKLPEPNKHCAELASDAVREALRSALSTTREGWRRLYRRH